MGLSEGHVPVGVMMKYAAVVFAGLIALVPECAQSETWRVEQDGSGDFVTIHDATIACSAGDTIMIGPGRYDDFHPFTAPAWTTEVIVGGIEVAGIEHG